MLALQQQVEQLEGRCAQLESGLVEARQQALAAEASLAKATRCGTVGRRGMAGAFWEQGGE